MVLHISRLCVQTVFARTCILSVIRPCYSASVTLRDPKDVTARMKINYTVRRGTKASLSLKRGL